MSRCSSKEINTLMYLYIYIQQKSVKIELEVIIYRFYIIIQSNPYSLDV